MLRHVITGCVAIALISPALACSRESTQSPISPSPAGNLTVGDIAASASAADNAGSRRTGSAPTSNGGPRITATGNQTVINGGTLAVTINGDASFNTVYMFIGGRTLGLVGEFGAGIDGYYEMRLPSSQTTTTVRLTFPQEIPLREFDLQFGVANSAGAVGPYVSLSTHVTTVGTGDIQVTLSWDADSDVDLHVVAPGGDEIYYGRRESPTGGKLDLDSNAGCSLDHVRNENITWPVGRAPRGSYTVRVDYWSACGVTRTNYTVLVNNGGSVQVVDGFFTGSGDAGGAGSGRTVATFERTTGPSITVSEARIGGDAASSSVPLAILKKLVKSPATGK